jgi:hypothetical protein
MKVSLAFAAAIMVLAGSPAADAAPPEVSAAPAASSPSGAGGKTVEGVTVVGKPLPTKECSSRDKDCILTVVAELKKLYPEQLKRFCFQRQMRAMRNNALFGDSDLAGSEPPEAGSPYSTAAPLAIACKSDKK